MLPRTAELRLVRGRFGGWRFEGRVAATNLGPDPWPAELDPPAANAVPGRLRLGVRAIGAATNQDVGRAVIDSDVPAGGHIVLDVAVALPRGTARVYLALLREGVAWLVEPEATELTVLRPRLRSWLPVVSGAARGAAAAAAWSLYQLAAHTRALLRPGAAHPGQAAARRVPSRVSAPAPRVLVLCPYHLEPADHGGAVRIRALLEGIAPHCEVRLVWFAPPGAPPPPPLVAAGWCRELIHAPLRRELARGGDPLPPSAALFHRDALHVLVRELVVRHTIDVVQVEYTELGGYLTSAADARTILVEHDIATRSLARRLARGLHRRVPGAAAYGANYVDLLRLRRFEGRACRSADLVHVMSEEDGRYLTRFLAAASRVRVVPNGVDCAAFAPPAAGARHGVILVGNFDNPPNIDALERTLLRIWPLVRARLPAAQLTVAGAQLPERFMAWHGRDGIVMLGRVPDMRPVYFGARAMLTPLRGGSGTRLKLLEAFAAGTPVVATRLAAEGLPVRHDEHLLLAERPAELAAALCRLLGDPDRQRRLAEAARALVCSRFDWSRSVAANLESISVLCDAVRAQRRT